MPYKHTILVIEDDPAIREGLVDAQDFDGYAVLEAGNGETGIQMAVSVTCDLILLDLILPGPSGFDILKAVRASHPTLPVIIMTARGEEADRVKGLKLGADDYVVKPFSIKELLARIEAVLRRSPERPSDISIIPIPNGKIDLNTCEIHSNGKKTATLSEREAELIRYLAQNAGRIISRQEILSRVWQITSPKGIDTRTIDMHIARLREKIQSNTKEETVIRTVRGKGYIFQAEIEEKK